MKSLSVFFLCTLSIGVAHATVDVQTNSDGSHVTAVLINGSTTRKYDIVFVGDGFTSSAADQTKFNNAVLSAIDALQNKAPYAANLCAFNVWRVNVISAESGIDHPLSGVTRNTELNCTFGDNVSAPERVIYSTTPALVTEAANYAPAYEAVYVLVNDTQYGGAAGSIVYTSLNTSMQEVIVHELGHFTGHLADEYTCYFCDGRAEPAYSGPEPGSVNLTKNINRSTLKWGSFVAATTPLPTTVDTPTGVVGAWAGGGYSPTGIYRPQNNCLMHSLGNELCAVCNDALTDILHPDCTPCERDPNSIACMLTKLRKRFYVYKPKYLKIPECCFCPLMIDLAQQVEIQLSVKTKDYNIQIVSADGKQIETSIRDTERGASIFFTESTNVGYFLQVIPLRVLMNAEPIDVSVTRNGVASPL
ncbi:MAG: M64 family metallopeptidase [Chryseolinea sp.]